VTEQNFEILKSLNRYIQAQ